MQLRIVIAGLSITSSWGNGHATTYRGLVSELSALGHDVLFLERDLPWYAENRDLPEPPFGRLGLYSNIDELKTVFAGDVEKADLCILGSYVPDGVAAGEWITSTCGGATAFYDIDTPVTLAKLERGEWEYLAPHLIPRFDLYLSFTGGPTLKMIESRYGSPRACALYCSVDPQLYFPGVRQIEWDLAYMGTYSADRQPGLDALLVQPARLWSESRMAVVGPQYPESIHWPENVERVQHLSPSEHRDFYNAQRYTLNITRAEMRRAGFSPSVRLFEAAACGTPIISDDWPGLDTFFRPGVEIFVASSAADVLSYLRDTSEEQRVTVGERARRRVLAEHTAAHRASELLTYAHEVLARRRRARTANN